MSKGTGKPQESGSLDQMTPQEMENQQELMETPTVAVEQSQGQKPPDALSREPKKPKETKVHRLSGGKKLYTPKERERKPLSLLTVEQYLRKANQDKAVSDLIWSLHKTKVQSFAEWERDVAALLKKQTW